MGITFDTYSSEKPPRPLTPRSHILLILLITVGLWFGLPHVGKLDFRPFGEASDSSTCEFMSAYRSRAQGEMVTGRGVVQTLLSDDMTGSRHQRFILRTELGQTVLVAHNIDIAPRIPNLRIGDIVELYGQYEWNVQGGVVHWTHHDPAGRHTNGWIRHRGRVYR